jgi:hypothetical protein
VSFPIPLSGKLDASHVHFVPEKTTPPALCPGTAPAPQAASGQLCVYEVRASGATEQGIFPQSTSLGSGADPYGFGINFAAAAGTDAAYGTWAVTG